MGDISIKKLVIVLCFFMISCFAVDDSYVLGPGDTLDIYVYSLNMANELEKVHKKKIHEKISNNGFINIPAFGLLKAEKLSIAELKAMLIERYNELVPVPVIKISLYGAKEIPIYVMGEVMRPGLYMLSDKDLTEKSIYNVVIQEARGFTQKADKSDVVVNRNGKKIHVTLFDRPETFRLSENIVLQRDDVVVVAAVITDIYIMGQVKYPGSYPYLPEATLMDYILRAGGIQDSGADEIGVMTSFKDRNNVHIIKLDPRLRLPVEDVKLSPKSIVYVPKGFLASWEDVLRLMQNVRDTFVYPNELIETIRTQGE